MMVLSWSTGRLTKCGCPGVYDRRLACVIVQIAAAAAAAAVKPCEEPNQVRTKVNEYLKKKRKRKRSHISIAGGTSIQLMSISL